MPVPSSAAEQRRLVRRLRSAATGLAAGCGLFAVVWAVVLLAAPRVAGAQTAEAEIGLLEFSVPGHEPQMQALGRLFALHHSPRTACTLWDAWLPMSTLWPALGAEATAEPLRAYWRQVLLSRAISSEGYVSMQQHRGLAHPAGWPFPTWPQAGGVGWHFTYHGNPYGQTFGPPASDGADWQLQGASSAGIDAVAGWQLQLVTPRATMTSPTVSLDAFVAPFLVIEADLSQLPAEVQPYVEWTSEDRPEFAPGRRMAVSREPARQVGKLSLLAVPLYRHEAWQGRITRLRLCWNNDAPAAVNLTALYTAIDTRHPITGSLFARASCDYFAWTGDVDMLRANIERVRRAVQYTLDEFDVRREHVALVRWPGHDGRSGLRRQEDGGTQLLPGHGVGNNYWDLLPFGHRDCLATIYLYDALGCQAELERAIAAHPEWQVPPPPEGLRAAALEGLAEQIRKRAGELFWNDETGRFVASIDADGVAHDYGFTFVNLEAIHYGLATPEQAQSILDWLDGRRRVAGDTSQAEDIYHWRFAPRATTRRNIDWYVWVWSRPEDIPWGHQVQDGGAVLGFSYFDLMARLRVAGPDDAWRRLEAILAWFVEVEQAGGYRRYYADATRGTLQGGGTPGGLGIDHEFLESVLVPQVMLYGFLGLRPTPEGAVLRPRLPTSWPSLALSRIHLRDHVLDIEAGADGRLTIVPRRPGRQPLRIELDDRPWQIVRGPAMLEGEHRLKIDFQPQAATVELRPAAPN